MNNVLVLDFKMNGFLLGTVVLLIFWLVIWIFLKIKKLDDNLMEMRIASTTCMFLGITEPLFVPDYWTPPSILKLGEWDLESFLFCFAVGGISAVLTEFPRIKKIIIFIDYWIWRFFRLFLIFFNWATGTNAKNNLILNVNYNIVLNKRQIRNENMILIAFFVAMFGAISHLSWNVIYEIFLLCIFGSLFIIWRRPDIKWQVLGGGLTFTLLYTVILLIVHVYEPGFYQKYWNLDDLSGIYFLNAPVEEYMYAFSFGVFWAPLYETWKNERKLAPVYDAENIEN